MGIVKKKKTRWANKAKRVNRAALRLPFSS